ncbi:hypothetical protein OG730_34685 [Streptomyces sp. NBC_01298]|uniref:hypothetical protein n=1 Tax=Streptomyces sp. NBC_01298 TaxID=2903817 RepID=UPI002E15FC5B|nr:hypothetical protein OG730_34685 [Streptomyces sp. NBC_01298]
MSHIMPDPEFDTPDEFDRLMAENKVPVLTPFAAMFNKAEEVLADSVRLEGFTPEEIGRMALECLPEAEQAAALDELFYTYWAAREQDRQTLARHQAAGGAR